MDDRRFDTLARSIGVIRSRRTLLTTLSGAVLAGALGLVEPEVAAARKRASARCGSNAECASGRCLKYGPCKTSNGRLTGKCRCACTTDTQCGAGRICRKRACFTQCSPSGACGSFQQCGSGACGCFNTTTPEAVCVFVGENACLTDACTVHTDCPVGYVCGVLNPPTAGPCCGGKVRTCMAPCQAGSVKVAAATAADRDGPDGGDPGQSIGGH
jgi:hypothetical protein